MNKYKIHWLNKNTDPEIIEGHTIEHAFSRRGYGGAVVGLIDHWEEVENNGKQINLSNEDILDIEDKIMNATGGMILILENEKHPQINKFIDKFNLITSTLIKHGIIPDRELYQKHE